MLPMIRFAAALLLLCPIAAHAAAPTPVGTWRTFDDLDGQESGAVQIVQTGSKLYGTIVSIADPAKRDAVCRDCSDDRKDQKVMGMQVIRGLQPDGAKWDGGQILDPKTGKTYHCSMRLEDGGNKLVVRGYLGLPLLGRSQTWIRTSS